MLGAFRLPLLGSLHPRFSWSLDLIPFVQHITRSDSLVCACLSQWKNSDLRNLGLKYWTLNLFWLSLKIVKSALVD